MRTSKLMTVALLVSSLGVLSACASDSKPVIAPVTMNVGDLQGTTVDLVPGQVLDIGTGDLAVDSYSGKVDDSTIAAFVPGRKEGGATFNPGVNALATGKTTVVLSNKNGGIQNVTFTVHVSKK